MNTWLSRTENLIGKSELNKFCNSNIIVFGCGGVGSYTIEGLVRAGINSITIVDNDIIDVTNINRQLIADTTVIGNSKVEVTKNRLKEINPNIKITTYNEFLSEENIDLFFKQKYDYVVDAIDTISSKLALIKYCYSNNIPIISCMGTGNKLDPTKFEITDITKTSMCPLAKIIRKELRKYNIKHLKVLYSTEPPIKNNTNTPSSISFVPSVAGLIIAGEVFKDIIKD